MKIRSILGITAAIGLAIALPLLAAERLAVDTGQWESTVTMTLSGITIPREQLEKMPPAQRAQMEEMLKQMGVGTPRTMTDKSCLTEKDLDGNPFGGSMEQPGQKCESKQLVGTATRQEWTMQCSSPNGPATGRIVVDTSGRRKVSGTMEMRSSQGNLDAKFDSRWIAASCEGVKAE